MSDFIKRLRLIEAENSECSILAGNCADAIEIEGKKAATEILRLRAENEKLRAELRDADVILLNQARTIRDYQDAALKETGDE